MRDTTSPYLHITHPRPVSSLALLRIISEELQLPLIPLSKWTVKLEARIYATPLPSSKRDDPALTLLRHVHLAKDPTAIDDDVPTRIFDHVQIASPTLHGGDVSPLGIEDVRLWVRHWREVGIITDAS